jgi:hypothetical protein
MADVFRLTQAITAVTFGSGGRASLSTLPVDAQLRLTGQSSLAGFVDVIYGDKLHCIFRVDLMARSVTLQTMAAAAEISTRSALSSPSQGVPAHPNSLPPTSRRQSANRRVSQRCLVQTGQSGQDNGDFAGVPSGLTSASA